MAGSTTNIETSWGGAFVKEISSDVKAAFNFATGLPSLGYSAIVNGVPAVLGKLRDETVSTAGAYVNLYRNPSSIIDSPLSTFEGCVPFGRSLTDGAYWVGGKLGDEASRVASAAENIFDSPWCSSAEIALPYAKFGLNVAAGTEAALILTGAGGVVPVARQVLVQSGKTYLALGGKYTLDGLYESYCKLPETATWRDALPSAREIVTDFESLGTAAVVGAIYQKVKPIPAALPEPALGNGRLAYAPLQTESGVPINFGGVPVPVNKLHLPAAYPVPPLTKDITEAIERLSIFQSLPGQPSEHYSSSIDSLFKYLTLKKIYYSPGIGDVAHAIPKQEAARIARRALEALARSWTEYNARGEALNLQYYITTATMLGTQHLINNATLPLALPGP